MDNSYKDDYILVILSCKKYRDLNLPTPEIAVPRAAKKHIRDQYPVVKITNNTNTQIRLPKMSIVLDEYCWDEKSAKNIFYRSCH